MPKIRMSGVIRLHGQDRESFTFCLYNPVLFLKGLKKIMEISVRTAGVSAVIQRGHLLNVDVQASKLPLEPPCRAQWKLYKDRTNPHN
jgi:hypothetical protein